MTQASLRELLKSRQLLPHQVEFIEAALGSRPRGRILLADEVGLGKTHACAALVWALAKERSALPRTLILGPGAVLAHFKAQLEELGVTDSLVVDAAGYRRLEARTRRDENPWIAVRTVLTTMDFVKREDRLGLLVETPWDLVILEDFRSQRGRVVRALWDSDRVDLLVAVSATAQTIRSDDFEQFADPETKILRRRARDLRDWDGRPLLGDAAWKIVEVVRVDLSAEERELCEALKQLLGQVTPDDARRRFVLRILVRRAASSLFALEQSVRRALTQATLPVHDRIGEAETPIVEPDLAESFEDADERPAFLIERDQLQRLVELIDRVEADTKWKRCSEILRSHLLKGRSGAVVFCDFVDTAEYLVGLLQSVGVPVGVVTGKSAQAERQEAVEVFREEGGVLVLTSGASEGLSLSFVKLCVHYDLPSHPNALAQRLGRVHRYGAPPGPVRHMFFVDEIFTFEPLVRQLFAFDGADGPSNMPPA